MCIIIITFEYLHNLLNLERENKVMNGQQQQKTGILFGRAKQKQRQPAFDINSEINSLTGRLRVLEERINNVNRKIELDESNLLDNVHKTSVEFKTMNSEIVEIKRAIEEIKEKMEVIVRELPNLAAKSELDVLKKYIELWEPLNFVTRDEFDKRLNETQNAKK